MKVKVRVTQKTKTTKQIVCLDMLTTLSAECQKQNRGSARQEKWHMCTTWTPFNSETGELCQCKSVT